MKCQEVEADLVDLARRGELNVPARERLDAHLGRCRDCADRLDHERELTSELKALADAAPPPRRLEEIERHLLRQFAAQHVSAVHPDTTGRPFFAAYVVGRWRLAAAAIVIVVGVGWMGSASWRWATDSRPDSTGAANSVVQSGPGTPAPPAVAEIPAQAPRAARTPAPSGPGGGVRNATFEDRAADRPDMWRFVELPSAAGLPGFESGRIVRLEVLTRNLPAFGVEIPPEFAASVVEADVLVGQDGQPRAIRFITSNQEPRRRQ
jgi:hypothetical protein